MEVYKKFIIALLIVFLAILIFYSAPAKKTVFTFINNETNETLNGEIFFDNYSQGYLQNGSISVHSINTTPQHIILIGEDGGKKYEAKYFFPKEYYSYKNFLFTISNKEIDFSKEYYPHKKADSFSNVLEPHFKKSPITWKIVDPTQCWKTEEDKIRRAFIEIENSSEGYVRFQESDLNPDILILCYTNFTEKYNQYNAELEEKKKCSNMTFYSIKNSASNTELGVTNNDYKISARIVFQEKNMTIWEVCKVDSKLLSFNPLIIYYPDFKLSDYLLGEGGPTENIGNIILRGEARFFGDKNEIISCTSGFPLVEVHEILHVLAFGHIIKEEELDKDIFGYTINSPQYMPDILYPYKMCLYQTNINNHYSSCLKYIYSNGVVGNCSSVRFMF